MNEAPLRMRQMSPDIKMLLIVRDPVTRLISKYTMDIRRNTWNKTFEESVLNEDVI